VKYSVSIRAEGDREIKIEEVVELADAVAIHSGIAAGAGTMAYGAQILVEADYTDEALDKAIDIFNAAVITAKLPIWPIVKAETMTEDEDWEDAFQ
jgi:hypothetical protein